MNALRTTAIRVGLGILIIGIIGGLYAWRKSPRTKPPTLATQHPAASAVPVDVGNNSATPVTSPAQTAPAKSDASLHASASAEESALAAVPNQRLRQEISALPPDARRNALRILASKTFPREDYESLHVDAQGGIYYACTFPLPPTTPGDAHTDSAAATTAPTSGSSTATTALAPVPIDSPPVRHSRPGATNVLYLDFNGHIITGTNWNTANSVTSYDSLPYDTDGDPTTFSDAEQAVILEVWARVAEDYAPFDIDVTTEEPASFTRRTGRALITRNVDRNGQLMPSSTAAGVAYVDVFNTRNYVRLSSPALCYYNQVGTTNTGNIAAVTSHELGHNLGLSHDGKTDGTEYYSTHGSGNLTWGPIMGNGYYSNVSQWSKGDYYLANNTEDDFAIIASSTGYRTDEDGPTLATAAPLTGSGNSVNQAGVLSRQSDVDTFVFNTAAGQLSFTASTYRAPTGTHGGNADIKLEVLNSAGEVLATADPADSTDASLTLSVASGQYFVRLTPAATGDPFANPPTGWTSYGSAGQYTLTGSIVASAPSITSGLSVTADGGYFFTYQIQATNSPQSYSASGLPAGLTLDTATGIISGRPTAIGSFAVTIGATNAYGSTQATLALTVATAPPAIVSQSSGRFVAATGANLSFSLTTLSPGSSATYQWKHNGRIIAGATSATLNLSSVTLADSGWYLPIITNAYGTTIGQPIFVQVSPVITSTHAWGYNSYGQTNVPSGLTNVVALAAGDAHSLALKADGSIVAWGANYFDQINVPAGLIDVVAIAAGYAHSLALKADGSVVAWGSNSFDQTTIPSGLTNVVAIAAGSNHSLALKADGSVVAWGNNSYGQTNVPAGLTNIAAIAAGSRHSLALKTDGSIVAWGNNSNNQTSVPAGLSNVIALAAGLTHSLALKADGSVVAWGDNSYGQTNVPSGLTNVVALAAGSYYSLALKSDGSVVAWGANSSGQSTVPTGLTNAIAIAAGDGHILALRDASITYATYRAVRFNATQATDDAISGPDADPDQDGLSNLLEYLLDLDPLALDSNSTIATSLTDNTYVTLTYVRRTDITDAVLTVEVSSDLITWNSDSSATVVVSVTTVDSTHERIVVRDATPLSSSPLRFIRLKAVR